MRERGAAGGSAASLSRAPRASRSPRREDDEAVREDRLALVRRLLRAEGGVALLVLARHGHDPDLAPFVGSAHLGSCLFLVPAAPRRRPVLIYFTAMERDEARNTGWRAVGPEDLELSSLAAGAGRDSSAFLAEAALRGLRRLGVPAGSLLLAGSPSAAALGPAVAAWTRAGYRAAPGDHLTRQARKRKTPTELASARLAGGVVVEAFGRIAACLAAAAAGRDGILWLGPERLRAGRLRAEAAAVFGRHGYSEPHGNIVAAGADAAVPHSQGASERPLRRGETLVVDLYPQAPRSGIFADATRTFVVGEVPEAVRDAHHAVVAALEAARSAVRPSVSGADLQRATCRRFAALGWSTPADDPAVVTGYVHGLGHGVGFELHELPSFRPGSDPRSTRIEEGDLITLEPGLYHPGAGWGIRVEDYGAVGRRGFRDLAPMPYALAPSEWKTLRTEPARGT